MYPDGAWQGRKVLLRQNWRFILQLELRAGCINRAAVPEVKYGADKRDK